MLKVSGVFPSSQDQNLVRTARGLSTWATGSIFLILLYALAFSSEGSGKVVSIFSHGTLIAVAFGSIGSLNRFSYSVFHEHFNRKRLSPPRRLRRLGNQNVRRILMVKP